MMKAKVIVMPKAAVLDPQGNAVRDAMRHLGMPEVRSVRIGKYMEINIKAQNGELEPRLHRLCRDLLSNPVIEDYQLLKGEGGKQKETPNVQPPTSHIQRQKSQAEMKREPKRKKKTLNAQRRMPNAERRKSRAKRKSKTKRKRKGL